jgi:hypothetical protein
MSSSNLTVSEQHQLRIARATLKMRDEMVPTMGPMTKDEARAVIRRLTGVNLNSRAWDRAERDFTPEQ